MARSVSRSSIRRVDSEEEEWAQKYGIEPIPLAGGEIFYLGLVAVALDQEETIKFMDPVRVEHLEYDITRIITRVQSPQRRKIGIISGYPVFGQSPAKMGMGAQSGSMPAWFFINELKKTYTLQEYPATQQTLDPDLDLLMLIHPRDLSQQLLYAVDQFVVGGGNLMVFSDPLPLMDNNRTPAANTLQEKLFPGWGIKMEGTQVLADLNAATRLRTQDNRVENNPLWLSLKPGAFNPADIITAKLESMLLPMSGAIQSLASNDIEYAPLLQSSTQSALVDAYTVRFGGQNLRRDFKASGQKYDIAVKLTGTFNSAFPEGRPSPAPEAAADQQKNSASAEAHRVAGTAKATVVVVADADLLFDAYYVDRQNMMGLDFSRVFNDNLNFVLNTSEVLTGDHALVDIRSRGKFERPFTRVQALERRAQDRWLAREQELLRKADATNAKLRQLQQQKDKSQRFILSQEQEAEIQKFKAEKLKLKKELKIVRRNLRADIETLGTFLKGVNIFLMPLVVSLVGIVYALYRRRQRMLSTTS